MTGILFVLLWVALAAYGIHLCRKPPAPPCVLDPADKIEWFAQQRRDRHPDSISDSLPRQWRHGTQSAESRAWPDLPDGNHVSREGRGQQHVRPTT
jgi:hypothetical protein